MPDVPIKELALRLPNREVKALWFELRRARPWRTLALVSADGASVVQLAHQFAVLASLVPKRQVLVLDAVPRAPGDIVRPPVGHYGVKAMREGMQESEILGEFVPDATTTVTNAALDISLLAIPTPAIHAYAIPLIAVADATVMCVELGKSQLARTRVTLQHLDPDRLLGTALIGGG